MSNSLTVIQNGLTGRTAEKIAGCDALPVALDEGVPRGLVGLVGVRQQAVVQHDPSDGLPGDLVAQALEFAVDVAVTLRGILPCNFEHELADPGLPRRGQV